MLKDVINNVKVNELDKVLDSTQRILNLSARVNKTLGADAAFIAMLANKFGGIESPLVRVNLLKVLHAMCLKSSAPKTFLKNHKLLKNVKAISEKDPSIMVKQMANTLLKEGSEA